MGRGLEVDVKKALRTNKKCIKIPNTGTKKLVGEKPLLYRRRFKKGNPRAGP